MKWQGTCNTFFGHIYESDKWQKFQIDITHFIVFPYCSEEKTVPCGDASAINVPTIFFFGLYALNDYPAAIGGNTVPGAFVQHLHVPQTRVHL